MSNDDPPHTTLDDCDVNWQYMGDTWGTNHTDDPLVSQYYQGTFESTTVHGAYARLCWTGTKAQILGGKRKNHALYTVSVDNGDPVWLSGYSEKAQIPASLYETEQLEWGNHQIVLTNMPKTNMTKKDNVWFDIDYAEIDGWPIDCKDLPEITVKPTETVIPASAITHMSSSNANATTSDNSTLSGNSTVHSGNTTSNSTSAMPGNATASLTHAPSASNGSVPHFTNSSSLSHISPTTTIMMSSATIDNSTSTFGGSSASATNSSSIADPFHAGTETHIALYGLIGAFLARWLC
ncbi:uncharacterized protein I303_107091 [Kwoniella dejecticola CBS 10117]|uniref:Uncharacterized protein n=1 Tax=Kwoniella dejecticola CBS 10117 TaxID=1296121 RepID=A0A1A5ZYQ5_9TREE|nr:uncharacterized protein I303_06492 [Kwoniella dejecticola CBS 10117]OBR82934.1 hypothetical protein I303_06492 [Kwoniella dejecticola CBS 10117]